MIFSSTYFYSLTTQPLSEKSSFSSNSITILFFFAFVTLFFSDDADGNYAKEERFLADHQGEEMTGVKGRGRSANGKTGTQECIPPPL